MKIYSEQEFLDWFAAQNGDMSIEMASSHIGEGCTPCLLGAFFVSKGFTDGFVDYRGTLSEYGNADKIIAKVELDIPNIFAYFDADKSSEVGEKRWRTIEGLKYCLLPQFAQK